MKSSKNLRRPSNWQDFETLCKKLWGEIWNCVEIKKNGRSGQNQQGVDIYGIPKNEEGYFGIQCKGKNEYTQNKLSKNEIDEEIAKAKKFNPKLIKFYIATTSEKDTEIEEYIRLKNIESISNKSFEIHLYSWEDIVDLIDENPKTYRYYIDSQNFNESESLLLTFANNLEKIELESKYLKLYETRNQKIISKNDSFHSNLEKLNLPKLNDISLSTKNLSFVSFQIQVVNTGNKSLENFKIYLNFEGNITELSVTDYILGPMSNIFNHELKIKNKYNLEIEPKKSIIVPEEIFESEMIYLKSVNEKSEIKVLWKFVSKSYSKEGELNIYIQPQIETVHRTKLVEDPFLVGSQEFEITEFIIEE